MDNLHPELHAPTALNVTVAATRQRQVRRSARPREYLTERPTDHCDGRMPTDRVGRVVLHCHEPVRLHVSVPRTGLPAGAHIPLQPLSVAV